METKRRIKHCSLKSFIPKLPALIKNVENKIKYDESTEWNMDFLFQLVSPSEDLMLHSHEELITLISGLPDDTASISLKISYRKRGEPETLGMHLWNYYGSLDVSFSSRQQPEEGMKIIEECFSSTSKILNNAKYYRRNIRAEKLDQKRAELSQGHSHCIDILNRFDTYQTRLKKSIDDEKTLQEFIYPILKSQFPDLEDEMHFSSYAASKYIPDFGIPSLKLIIEAKYLRRKADWKTFQRQIHDDILGYSNSSQIYKKIIFFIYKDSHIIEPDKFRKDLIRKNKNILDIIIANKIIHKEKEI